MQGKHRDWAIYVRKLVWNQHICKHNSPGAFLWSIIYVLKRAKKLYLKINFFAFFRSFLSLKEKKEKEKKKEKKRKIEKKKKS